MIQDRIEQPSRIEVQSKDPIGTIAGQTMPRAGGRPQRDVAPEGGFGIAWALGH